MKNNSDSLISKSLIELLKTLSKYEITRLDKFLRSPYLNNRNDVARLFSIIKDYYPKFKNENISKEKVFKQLYPEQKYKDDLMRNLISHLLSSAENFLAQESFSEDPFDKEKHLIKALRKKHLDILFEKNISLVFKEQEEKFKDEDYFSNMELLETENDFYNETKTQTGKRADDELYISRKMRYIANSFLIRMLKMCCLALNEKDIVKFKLDFAAFDYFLEFFRTY